MRHKFLLGCLILATLAAENVRAEKPAKKKPRAKAQAAKPLPTATPAPTSTPTMPTDVNADFCSDKSFEDAMKKCDSWLQLPGSPKSDDKSFGCKQFDSVDGCKFWVKGRKPK